jgi:hypothetical protein
MAGTWRSSTYIGPVATQRDVRDIAKHVLLCAVSDTDAHLLDERRHARVHRCLRDPDDRIDPSARLACGARRRERKESEPCEEGD